MPTGLDLLRSMLWQVDEGVLYQRWLFTSSNFKATMGIVLSPYKSYSIFPSTTDTLKMWPSLPPVKMKLKSFDISKHQMESLWKFRGCFYLLSSPKTFNDFRVPTSQSLIVWSEPAEMQNMPSWLSLTAFIISVCPSNSKIRLFALSL